MFGQIVYKIELLKQDEDGDYWWKEDSWFGSYEEALTWYNRYVDMGMETRLSQEQLLKAFEQGVHFD